jgi:hypothetical protein
VTTFRRISLLLVLGACLAAAGCGSDDDEGAPIPADQAAALDRELTSIEARLQQGSVGACEDIFRHPTDPNESAVERILSSLPSDVDPDVRSALQQSFDNLWDLAQQECDRKAAEEPDQPEPTPTPETTTPTETPTETTETTPPDTDTETNPEEAPLPPDGDGESGGEVPEGEGNGGGVGPGTAKEKKEKE